jgi:hypothetical protein
MSPAQIESWVRNVLRDALHREPTRFEMMWGLASYAAELERRVSAGYERRSPIIPPRPPKAPPKSIA